MDGGSSSSSADTTTTTKNTYSAGNQGINLTGLEGTFNFDIATSDQGTVQAAAAITSKALDALNNVTGANLLASKAQAEAQNKTQQDFINRATANPNSTTETAIKYGSIAAMGIGAAYLIAKKG